MPRLIPNILVPMEVIIFEAAIIAVLIAINGLFSMSELAVVSARKVRLQPLADGGSRAAAVAIELAENPRQFLSTVQVGITLVGILAGAFGGATISEMIAELLAEVPVVGPYSSTAAFVLVVAAITYFSIVLGELIPKSFALNSPEKLAMLVSRPMALISRLAGPIVGSLSAPTTAVLRLIRVHASVDPPVTDEEISGLIDVGTKAGVFEAAEQDIIESVMALEEQPVTSLMTPRTDIIWIDLSAPLPETLKSLKRGRYSRIPVGNGNLDKLEGYVSTKTLLAELVEGKELNLHTALKTPLYIPESLSILDLLARFRDSDTHLAMVVDEYGGIEGLVTTHDIAEAIVGELATGHPTASPMMTRRPDGSVTVDGRMSIFDFQDEFDIDAETLEGVSFDTVAGLALFELGRIPAVGDSFSWQDLEFIVEAMDRNRIKSLVVTKMQDLSDPKAS